MNTIYIIFLALGFISAAIIVADQYIGGRKHEMGIMNIVWPLTALWASIVGLIAYYAFGRARRSMPMPMPMTMKMPMKMDMPMATHRPMWQQVALSALHCGAGCTVADISGEWLASLLSIGLIFGWAVDYVLALIIGIMFQYAAIRSMETISIKQGYLKALKVDFWSLTSWQIGMYGWMAIAIFVIGIPIDRFSSEFWFMMQVAMLVGFITSYPTNWLLIKYGIKKGM